MKHVMKTLQMPTRGYTKLLGVSSNDTYASMTIMSSRVGRSNGLNTWGLSLAKTGSLQSLPVLKQDVIPACKTTEGIYQHTSTDVKLYVGCVVGRMDEHSHHNETQQINYKMTTSATIADYGLIGIRASDARMSR